MKRIEVPKENKSRCKGCCLLNKYCFTMLKEGKREKCEEEGKSFVFKEGKE
ncbi:MAG: hypothetical protein ACRDDY_10760 [Clostridium sp.]|uniref:hypothetical protein n=1 Tax=Clostridium sp. TaxID=1506 RepID=UPI003EE76A43